MEITDTTPDNGGTGIALEQTIDVVFDVEADVDSVIGSGHLTVVTSANKLYATGPGLENFIASSEDLLDSQVFQGFVAGSLTTSDNLTFTFTPDAPLEADRLYRVIASTSILSRTLADPVADVGNTSSADFTLTGPYTGLVNDTWTITTDTGGTLGVATFKYHRASTGLTSAAIPTDRSVELEDGVFINFTSGTFVVADSWVFASTVGVPLDNIFEFSFTTGSSTHVQVSEDTPSFQIAAREIEGLRRIDGVIAVDSGTLQIVSVTPANGASNIPLSRNTIVIVFNKALDPASLNTASIEVLMENLPFDESQQYSYPLLATSAISGSTLTLTFSG